jgi:hypothetical protein
MKKIAMCECFFDVENISALRTKRERRRERERIGEAAFLLYFLIAQCWAFSALKLGEDIYKCTA